MSNIGTLTAYITADTRGLIKGTRRSTLAVKKMTVDINKSLKTVGGSFTRAGRALTLGLTAPILGVGVAVLKMSGDFERSMNKVQALSQASSIDFARLEKQALDLGRTTQFSASQAAEAMGFFALAGYNADQILGALPSTLQLAAAAQIDLAEATDITTGILAGYRLKVSELEGANDVLVKAFTSAKLNLSDLGQAFKMAGPVAKAAGLAFDETAAVLGILANAQLQGTAGGTAFRNMLVKLQGPSREGSKSMKEWGINVADASGNMLPFVDILKQFERANKRVNNSVEFGNKLMEIFGLRAGPAMQALLGQGSDALANLQKKLQNAGGIAKRVAETQMRGFRGQMIALKSAVEGLAIAIGKSGLLKLMTDLAKRATESFRRMAKLNPEMIRMAIVVAAVAAALGPLLIITGMLVITIGALFGVVGIVLGVFGTLLAVTGFLFTPLGLLVTAFAGIIYVLMKTQGVTKILGKAWVALRAIFAVVLSSIGEILAIIGKGISKFIKGILILANVVGVKLPDGFSDAIGALDGFSLKMNKFSAKQLETSLEVSDNWGDAWNAFKTDMRGALDFAVSYGYDKGKELFDLIAKLSEGLKVEPPAAPDASTLLGGLGDPQLMSFIPTAESPNFNPPNAEVDTAWTKWLAKQRAIADDWSDIWAKTTINVAEGFAQGFADMITAGKSFGSVITDLTASIANQLIAQAAKSAIAIIGIEESKTAAKGAGAAPHPFLIPLFVGLALSAFSGAISKTKGAARVGAGYSGGGGGGTAAGMESDAGGNVVDLTLMQQGGSRTRTAEEEAENTIRIVQDALLATGGNLGQVRVVTEEI